MHAAPAHDESANALNWFTKALGQFEPDHLWVQKGSNIAKRRNMRESKFVTLAAQVGHASICDALQLASHALIASMSWVVSVVALFSLLEKLLS